MASTSDGPLLEGLPPEDVRRFLAGAHRRTYERGEAAFHEGDPGDALHLIVSGKFAIRVTTERGESAVLAIFPAGDIFGELALFRADIARTATVEALEPSETLAVTRDQLEELRRAHPEVTDVLLRIVAEKVARYTGMLMEALYVPAELRVLRRVLEVADLYGGGEVPITQEELATMSGASRGTANRVLRQEAARGTIELHRGRVRVLDADAIRRRAR